MIVIRVLAVLAAAGLALNAKVHLGLADAYTGLGDRPLSLGDQFYAQSAVAVVLAVAVLAKPHRLVWAAIAAFSAVSLVPLVVSRYRPIPVPGVPGGFEEAWTSDARTAAAAEVLSLVAAVVALVLVRRSAKGQLAAQQA